MPALYILAGPNGAGKSTAASLLLPESIYAHYTRFDADKIKRAKQREFYLKVRSYKEAGKLADEFVDEEFRRQCKAALKNKDHFVYEVHNPVKLTYLFRSKLTYLLAGEDLNFQWSCN